MTDLVSSQATLSFDGLTNQEAVARRAAGQGNDLPLQTSRTYKNIFRDNLFTFINIVLFFLGAILVLLGRVDDVGVIAFVIGTNAIVNIYQEIKAKQKLDKLSLVTRPKITLVREGRESVVDPNEIVVGDLLIVRPGDQIVVDGSVVGEGEINMDESLLTGESDLIPKKQGDILYSGSFCVSGSAHYVAEKVGKDSYANQLTAGAKTFRRVLTPLQKDINLIVRVLLVAAIFLWILAGISLLIGLTRFAQTVENAAVIAGLVPSGLFLMITLAYALGSVRMADRNALIQQSNAVESLSNINILCVDKTGTLTSNRLELQTAVPVGISEAELRAILGDYAASAASSNKTNEAIAIACPGQKRPLKEEVPFASAYKWSAQAFDDPNRPGVYVLGAPDILMTFVPLTDELTQRMQEATDQGLRVLLFAHTPTYSPMRSDDANQPHLPPGLQPLGLLLFGDELRPKVQDTLRRFREGHIQIKVISGDNPSTVAALATQAGLPAGIKAISGPELATLSDSEFAQVAAETTVFGRITPDQKARLVKTFQQQGHYVAMMGDGVNDVPSLKQSNVGISMESGSQITRGVADMVLLKDSFEALPDALLEGQRIGNSIRDVTRVSLTRVASFVILMLAMVIPGFIFPLTIKHNAILTLLTEGIPTLGITIWAKPGQPKERNLIRSVVPFVFPAMALLSLFSLIVYMGFVMMAVTPIAGLINKQMTLQQISQLVTPEMLRTALFTARNELVVFLIFCGLLLLLLLKPPTRFWVGGAPLSGDWRYPLMALGMLLIYVILVAVPGLRGLFDLVVLRPGDYMLLSGLAFLWALFVRRAWRDRWLDRFLQMHQSQSTVP